MTIAQPHAMIGGMPIRVTAVGDDTYRVEVILGTGDIELGAVEIKNATDDTRAVVDADGLEVHIDKALPTGTNNIGDVDIASALPAGTANIGKVDPNTATPTVYNVTLTVANTEYTQNLPAGCRGFEFQCRTGYDVRFAFATGKVAGPTAPYATLKAGDQYCSPPIYQSGSSLLYLASSTAAVVVEGLLWT